MLQTKLKNDLTLTSNKLKYKTVSKVVYILRKRDKHLKNTYNMFDINIESFCAAETC